NYPVQVIEQMTQILKRVEDSELIKQPANDPKKKTKRYITKTICYQAATMTKDIEASVINTLTNSGYTAFQISAWRPNAHILAFTSNKYMLTQLNLLWGVTAFWYDKYESTDVTIEDINRIAKEKGYVNPGDYTINLASMPIKEKGMVNTIRVSEIE